MRAQRPQPPEKTTAIGVQERDLVRDRQHRVGRSWRRRNVGRDFNRVRQERGRTVPVSRQTDL